MANSRSVPPALWAHSREALIYFFANHHGMPEAEDLAHETLAELWRREDYIFNSAEDFMKVCYGFANNILLTAKRRRPRHAAVPLQNTIPAAGGSIQGMEPLEA